MGRLRFAAGAPAAHGAPLEALEVAWFGAGTLALAAAAGPLPAVVFAAFYTADVALLRLFGR